MESPRAYCSQMSEVTGKMAVTKGITMGGKSSSERYRRHAVWETIAIKREALDAARFDDARAEEWRRDLIEWLDEAERAKRSRVPALYLRTLDEVSSAVNGLPTDTERFRNYVGLSGYGSPSVNGLAAALRLLPLPAPKDMGDSVVELLDREIVLRNERLDELEHRLEQTESALDKRLAQLKALEEHATELKSELGTMQSSIARESDRVQETLEQRMEDAFVEWRKSRDAADAEANADALQHVASLAAVAAAGEALSRHAAGTLSATDWRGRATRERRSALSLRYGSFCAFLVAGGIAAWALWQIFTANLALTVGDGIVRGATVAVIGGFGLLLLRESARHFREADTAEDVALSLTALAPFYAGEDDQVTTAARAQVGDAVLVKSLLSRFAHRDAAKHAGDINNADLPELVKQATAALKGP